MNITCKDLADAVERVCGDRVRDRKACVERLSVAWIVSSQSPLGRIAASRLLGLSERKVRTAIEKLREAGLVSVDAVAGVQPLASMPVLLRNLVCVRRGYLLAYLVGADRALKTLVSRHVVDLRDELLLSLEEKTLTLIAIVEGERVAAPGAPYSIAKPYLQVVAEAKPLDTRNALAFAFDSSAPLYHCCATLYALYRLCTTYSSASDTANTSSHATGLSRNSV